MTTTQPEKQLGEERYNVFCVNCGDIFSPRSQSPLWWKAKQFTAAHPTRLDCMSCDGEECGCVTKRKLHEPNAPYRVFGYDFDGEPFSHGFFKFTDAVKYFQKRDVDYPYISGVSEKVENRLRYGV